MAADIYFTIWNILYIVIIVPTVLGNGFILYCVWKFQKLRGNLHVLIANLAISDLIVGGVLIPADMLADIFHWKDQKYVCLTVLSLFILSMGSSCYNLLLISIERFISIVYPFAAWKLLSKPKVVFMIALGWAVTVLNGTISFYGIDTYTNTSVVCSNENAWPKWYQIYLDWMLIASLILNSVLYSIVVCIALRKAGPNTKVGGICNTQVRTKKNLHQSITMAIVLSTFLICWLPYATFSVIVTFWDTPYMQFVKRCALIPGFANSGINWIIYGYRNSEFRKAFQITLRCIPRRKSIGPNLCI